jgi:hypothetical protein
MSDALSRARAADAANMTIAIAGKKIKRFMVSTPGYKD